MSTEEVGQPETTEHQQLSSAVETSDASKELCQDMFEKLTDYLNGELAGKLTARDNRSLIMT